MKLTKTRQRRKRRKLLLRVAVKDFSCFIQMKRLIIRADFRKLLVESMLFFLMW